MITLGYAGTLQYYEPEFEEKNNKVIDFLKDLFWTYRVDNINYHTRSGYYLFHSLRYLKDMYPEYYTNIRVALWGLIDDRNKNQIIQMGIEEVVSISGYIDKNRSDAKMEQCDIFFLPLETAKNGNKPLFIPGKLYSLLKLGKPILALGDQNCSYAEILQKSGLGTIISPFNKIEIANQLRLYVDHEQELEDYFKPNMEYILNFQFNNLTKNLAHIFDSL